MSTAETLPRLKAICNSLPLLRFVIYGCIWFLLVPSHPLLAHPAGGKNDQAKLAAFERVLKRSTDDNLGPWIWPFNEDQINAIVEAHNDVRRLVEPEASNMMKMVWDEELSFLAQNWSEECVFAHPHYPVDYGQNLATHSDLVRAIYAWFSEYDFYDYDTMTCEPGKLCGHYTQVAWAQSYQVGCGIQDCGLWHVTTCNYRPAGNSPGRQPYQSGYVCGQCPSPSWCEDRLCNPECKAEGRSKCECTLLCLNCAETNDDECTCSCKPGWMGTDCVAECADTHRNCDIGWPDYLCGDPAWEFVDNFCVKMCGHCDPGPYDAADHCCGGLECATGLVDPKTCQCLCFDDRGDEYSCDLLKTTPPLPTTINTTTTTTTTVKTVTEQRTPKFGPAPEPGRQNGLIAFLIALLVIIYVIFAACVTWKVYLRHSVVVFKNKVFADQPKKIAKDSQTESMVYPPPILAWKA
ncbi:uncharacterized protein [Ptychodera flava]|uniref:uncharacterized protein n=1 Tax=Ptychodera flava TaxID=63121 RepID=UPI003969CC35